MKIKTSRVPKIYEEDYEVDETLFTEDSDTLELMKKALHSLTQVERRMFMIFTECGSNYSEFGRIVKASPQTARNYINRLRKKIIQYIDEHN